MDGYCRATWKYDRRGAFLHRYFFFTGLERIGSLGSMQTEVLLVVFTVFALLILWRVLSVEKKLRVFFQGKDARTMEGVLFDHAERLGKLEGALGAFSGRLQSLEGDFLFSVQKVAIVRFNPFGAGSGGEQSFSIALLNGHDTGIVLSGLYVHGQPMVYSKPIVKGASRYTLSEEEKQVLKQAMNGGES
mgnify:CR=1 FL=1